MSDKKRGTSTYLLPTKPRVASFASMAGKKESEGPLGHTFDETFQDDMLGEKSWEKAEASMLQHTAELCLRKGMLPREHVDVFLCGDLLNQIVSAAYTARQLSIPYLGLYGACSTMAESLLVGAMMVDGGFVDNALCATCSHFSTAERQYRYPLEMGTQRPPTAQWTVTGAGATLLTNDTRHPIAIEAVTAGKVIDFGQCDANTMGAAMAPAAADTLQTHLTDLGRTIADYDLIVTGDLGRTGFDLMKILSEKNGIKLDDRYIDCGCQIFLPEQDTHAGGSGCGCSASVLNGWLYSRMLNGEIKKMLFMATGALMSTTMSQQGESIPGVAHAIAMEVIG